MIDPTARIHPTATVEEPCEVGHSTAIWHYSHVRPNAKIGHGCIIAQNCYIGMGVSVGARCKVQNNVSIYENVTLEDEVFCGPSCVFTNVINPRAAIDRKHEYLPTVVGRGATICANATIVCGIRIGRWAMIGAGALVRRDVPDFAVMVGNPARRKGWVSISGHTIPQILVGEVYTCPHDGSRYLLASVHRLQLISPEPAVAP